MQVPGCTAKGGRQFERLPFMSIFFQHSAEAREAVERKERRGMKWKNLELFSRQQHHLFPALSIITRLLATTESFPAVRNLVSRLLTLSSPVWLLGELSNAILLSVPQQRRLGRNACSQLCDLRDADCLFRWFLFCFLFEFLPCML